MGRARRIISVRRTLQFHSKPAWRRGLDQCADLPLNFTLTAALAILILGEPLTGAKAIALGLALVAVWLLLAEAGAERGKINFASLAQVLLATVTMALTNLFYKIGLQHGAQPETMVATQAWMFSSLATIACIWRGGIRVLCAAAGAMPASPRSLCSALSCLMHALFVLDRRASWCRWRK